MIVKNKERLRAMRLDVIGSTLDGMDLEDKPLEQDVLEGLLFNIGKLLLEHLKESVASCATCSHWNKQGLSGCDLFETDTGELPHYRGNEAEMCPDYQSSTPKVKT